MLFKTPQNVIKEGQDLLVELKKKGITNHLQLASDVTLKEKVVGFLEHVKTALRKIEGEILHEIKKPGAAYNEAREKRYRAQKRILDNTQQTLLNLVTEGR